MRKAIMLLVALIITVGSFASVIEPKLNAADFSFPAGKSGKQISLLELSKISVRDYQTLIEHKMNFFEKIFFKKAQKNLRKSLDKNGYIENKKLETLLKEHYASGGKSQVVALLLVIFVGGLGIHRFYLGYTWQGIVQLLTLGGFGIWWLIDLIRIITGDLKPKNGEYETTL